MDLEVLSILTFFGLLAAIVIIDRKNIEFGLLLIRRTKKGRKQIENFAKKHRGFFNAFANVSVILGFILSIWGFIYLSQGVGVRLILPKVFPGQVSEGVQKVVFFIPLWYWVIGLFIIIVPHELFHGFLFALENIRIKSVGFLLFLIFPGGFVEPDEKQFMKSEPKKKMRVASVGSISNICVFILLILLSSFITRVFYEANGMVVYQINDTSYPAKQANLTGVITEINGTKIRDVEDFTRVLNQAKPGDGLKITTQDKTYNVTLIESPDQPGKGFLGVSILSPNLLTKIIGNNPNVYFEVKQYPDYQRTIIKWFDGLISWTALISVSVAIANLLPFLPFDGGVMWQALFEKITKNQKLARKMIIVLSFITYSMLILSFINVDKILGLLGSLI